MRKKKVHPLQEKLIDILIKNMKDPLTIREIQSRLNLSSTSIVAHHLKQLEKKGYLKRNAHNPRDYLVLNKTPDEPIAYLNLYGLAHCGPRGSILDGSPIDKIPISTRLIDFPASEAFMVKAKGDSMAPKINDGDLVVVRKTNNAENGDIVVCTNNEEALIKRIKKGREIILISLNQEYEPFVASSDFRMEGVVRSVYSYKI